MRPDPAAILNLPLGTGLAAASSTSPRLGRAAASTSTLGGRVRLAAVGLSVVGLGLALALLPGPSVLVIPLGLMILANEPPAIRWVAHD
jgi:hypothetical protein